MISTERNIFLIHKSNIKINSFLIETITEKVIFVKMTQNNKN